MSLALSIEEVNIEEQSCAFLWNSMMPKTRRLKAMMKGLSFEILKLSEKSWTELPAQYQKEITEAWTIKS